MNECTWDGQSLNWQMPHTYSSAVSSRSWLPFQMLAPLSGNQWTNRRSGWASMLGNDSSPGIPRLPRRASESFLGTQGSRRSGSSWPFWLYYPRGALPHILQTGSLLLLGLLLRVHPSWRILANMDPLPRAPALLFPDYGLMVPLLWCVSLTWHLAFIGGFHKISFHVHYVVSF